MPTASPRCMCTVHSLCIAHAGVHQNTVPSKARDNGGMHVMNPIHMTRDYGVDIDTASLRAFALPSDSLYISLFPKNPIPGHPQNLSTKAAKHAAGKSQGLDAAKAAGARRGRARRAGGQRALQLEDLQVGGGRAVGDDAGRLPREAF